MILVVLGDWRAEIKTRFAFTRHGEAWYFFVIVIWSHPPTDTKKKIEQRKRQGNLAGARCACSGARWCKWVWKTQHWNANVLGWNLPIDHCHKIEYLQNIFRISYIWPFSFGHEKRSTKLVRFLSPFHSLLKSLLDEAMECLRYAQDADAGDIEPDTCPPVCGYFPQDLRETLKNYELYLVVRLVNHINDSKWLINQNISEQTPKSVSFFRYFAVCDAAFWGKRLKRCPISGVETSQMAGKFSSFYPDSRSNSTTERQAMSTWAKKRGAEKDPKNWQKLTHQFHWFTFDVVNFHIESAEFIHGGRWRVAESRSPSP